ncbi:MarR family winged helix-turn-helix transcriptional regulator [Alkalitalea saponilacus]|uniref:DNA-binding transcriptional regulator, MarR family n=1 Tax=Alkalitalea saponilacus TaxID=889453 RepID=A0A1T5F642_9BACT|nr:MarR family transcriptional regulator [Alkalitalea saponilacus]ASB50163.1 MarR family transcriptional regulator [Alkalitalea saponilacus]SKB91580.1 DNA-binding transcriptional regulator, MarR family [Alkalitalea saponilacus]
MDYKSILIKIRRIVRSINLESKKVQKDFGVSIPQILCLEFLKNSPNYQATQRAIREHLNLNSSTVTGIIGRLEKNGLLARLPKSGDKRVTHITLTSSGDELLQKTPDLLQQRLSSKLKRLSPEELQRMSDSLETLIELLEIKTEELEEFPFISDDGVLEGKGEVE